jgi:hypothetical protein
LATQNEAQPKIHGFLDVFRSKTPASAPADSEKLKKPNESRSNRMSIGGSYVVLAISDVPSKALLDSIRYWGPLF